MLPIHFSAVLLAALSCFILGFLFHGPLFGKLWMKLANIQPTGNEKFSDMYGKMFLNFLGNILSAYVLAVVYLFATTSPYVITGTICAGIMCGFWVWLGFQVPMTAMDVIWMGKSKKLWLFEAVAALVCYMVMGAIIAAI